MADLVAQQYRRNDQAFERGTFRRRGDTIEIFPAHYEDRAWRISLFGDEIEAIAEFDPLTGKKTAELPSVKIYANSHYVTPRPTLRQAVNGIKAELKPRLDWLIANGKLLEAQRLEQRTTFDMEMIEATGSCAGIENYSRYLTGRRPGEPPPTFFEYIPDNALLFVDESHQTVPQLGGHVPRRLQPQVHPGRIRLPPALLPRQPAAQVRGVGGDAPRQRVRLGHARPSGSWRRPAASSPNR